MDGKEPHSPGVKKADDRPSRTASTAAAGDVPKLGSVFVRTSSANVVGPRLTFDAVKKVRNEPIPVSSGSGELIIRLDQHVKVKSVLQILSVPVGDGRRTHDEKSAQAASAEVSRMTSVTAAGEADAEAVEEGRFSCKYWASQQSVRDAKLGTLVVTSDRISFESSLSKYSICFIYEVAPPARRARALTITTSAASVMQRLLLNLNA